MFVDDAKRDSAEISPTIPPITLPLVLLLLAGLAISIWGSKFLVTAWFLPWKYLPQPTDPSPAVVYLDSIAIPVRNSMRQAVPLLSGIVIGLKLLRHPHHTLTLWLTALGHLLVFSLFLTLIMFERQISLLWTFPFDRSVFKFNFYIQTLPLLAFCTLAFIAMLIWLFRADTEALLQQLEKWPESLLPRSTLWMMFAPVPFWLAMMGTPPVLEHLIWVPALAIVIGWWRLWSR